MDMKELALWGLGNIASINIDLRHKELDTYALTYIFKIFKEYSENVHSVRNAIWALSQFYRGKSLPESKRKLPKSFLPVTLCLN